MELTISFYAKVSEPRIRQGIWELVKECDAEFLPPLSSRESSFQSKLHIAQQQKAEPVTYFAVMMEQHFLVAMVDSLVVGFMSFRHGFESEDLGEYCPSNYVTTVCVAKEYRNRGITRAFYHMMQQELPERFRLPIISTRTWSTNIAHIHLLERLQFQLVTRLSEHRGPGIDTVYYGKVTM